MNDEDIAQFMKAFEDFMQHASVEEQNYVRREAARKYTKNFYEIKAAEMKVSVDYYIQEFA